MPVPAKEDDVKIEPCVRCRRVLRRAETFNETADPAVVTYSLLKTQGVRPRVTTASVRRRVFYMPCGVSLGLGPTPENGAFSEDVHGGLMELLEKCPDLASLAWSKKSILRRNLS